MELESSLLFKGKSGHYSVFKKHGILCISQTYIKGTNFHHEIWISLYFLYQKFVLILLHGSSWGCCCCIPSVVSDSVLPNRGQPTRLHRPWDSQGQNTGLGCHFLLQCMKVKGELSSVQLFMTPWTETDIDHRLMDMGGGEEQDRCINRVTWKPPLSYVRWMPTRIFCMAQETQIWSLHKPRGVGLGG